MTKKVIDPAPIIKKLADRCLVAKGLECSILGDLIDMLRAAPGECNAPYWATEAAYKNGQEAGKRDAVVPGRWIEDFVFTFMPLPEGYKHCHCSECGFTIINIPSNYCPNCGAKMDRDKENA